MSLTFGFTSIRELLQKLKRDATALDGEVTSDGMFNFVVTGYSMIDWVKNDPSLPAAVRDNRTIQSLYDDPYLKVCRDLANGCKHFNLNARSAPALVSSATSQTGWGMGRYGMGGFGIGEESISIQLSDGTSISGLQLVQRVVATWEQFFSTHSI